MDTREKGEEMDDETDVTKLEGRREMNKRLINTDGAHR